MYANIAFEASFLSGLLDIDRELAASVKRGGCQHCGGPLHVANYPRKVRGIPPQMDGLFAQRFSLCCGHCRRRCTPASVRFLGPRVYAGAIMILATMRVLVCGASWRTLVRWSQWWTVLFPGLTLWLSLKARLVPVVDESRLPGSLLERFEQMQGGLGQAPLTKMLGALKSLTTTSSEVAEGQIAPRQVTHKMPVAHNMQDHLARVWATTKPG